ncbi:MAG TPA: hypothetical protein VGS11_03825 [Candidatus Bathyarchaeia archaeon]|nr:hypothetical protein [Candidatus Bathyarchaeia archaeon]
MQETLTAVCISKQIERWGISSVPFFCYTDNWKPFGREKTRERVQYLASRRNDAVRGALETFPATEHVLMIDSYYLRFLDQAKQLISDYTSASQKDPCIMGASTWALNKTRIRPFVHFWDTWTTPEATIRLYGRKKFEQARQIIGLRKVKAVGACYIYPRIVWERGGYGLPSDWTPEYGCEHNYLCDISRRNGITACLNYSVKLWREPTVYAPIKRLRCSAGELLRGKM